MNYAVFLKQIQKAHLTLREFAELLKMNRVSLSNYAKKGIVPSHLGVIATLLAEMGKRGIDYRSILQQVTIAPKKPRGAGMSKFGGDKQQRLF
jgi:transcriptional regulator with XRE-family HTH domain